MSKSNPALEAIQYEIGKIKVEMSQIVDILNHKGEAVTGEWDDKAETMAKLKKIDRRRWVLCEWLENLIAGGYDGNCLDEKYYLEMDLPDQSWHLQVLLEPDKAKRHNFLHDLD